MKKSNSIDFFKFSIEKVWKMIFFKCVGTLLTPKAGVPNL